ncbi:YfhE family protein [Anaerobacillus sp. MEB173]
MESKKRRAKEERRTLKKAQEVHFFSEFKAADRIYNSSRRG